MLFSLIRCSCPFSDPNMFEFLHPHCTPYRLVSPRVVPTPNIPHVHFTPKTLPFLAHCWPHHITTPPVPPNAFHIHLQSKHIVLVGDQNQLPPTIHSEEAQERKLIRSVYHHLLDIGSVPVLLDVQYRMHPAIAAFPMAQFYGARITNGVTELDRPLPFSSFRWPRPEFPVAIITHSGRKAEQRDARASYYNLEQVEIVREAVIQLLRGGGLRPRDIAIISPYQGQTYHLHQRIKDLLPHGVRTIDSFQVQSLQTGAPFSRSAPTW